MLKEDAKLGMRVRIMVGYRSGETATIIMRCPKNAKVALDNFNGETLLINYRWIEEKLNLPADCGDDIQRLLHATSWLKDAVKKANQSS